MPLKVCVVCISFYDIYFIIKCGKAVIMNLQVVKTFDWSCKIIKVTLINCKDSNIYF